MDVIRLLGTEQWCNTTANTFNNGELIRLCNITAAAVLVTQQANSTVNTGTVSVAAGQTIFVVKPTASLLVSNSAANAVVGVSVARPGSSSFRTGTAS